MSYTIPTVNIVVSFDPNIVIEFQKAASFSVFKKNVKEDESTQFFDNGPNSTLISLKHTYMGDKKEGSLVIEVIDPDQNAVGTLTNLTTSFEDMLELEAKITTNFVKEERDKIFEDVPEVPFPQDFRGPADKAYLDPSYEAMDGNNIFQKWFNNIVDYARNLLSSSEPDMTGISEGYNDLVFSQKEEFIPKEGEATPSRYEFIQKIYEQQTTPMQRPVYIAYGVGDDLKNWSRVKSFGRILKIEYSFTSQGVKTLKFIFNPLKGNPTLTQHGLHTLGHLANNLKTIGLTAYRIFNKEDFEAQKQFYLKLNKSSSTISNTGATVRQLPSTPTSVNKIKNKEIEDFFSDYSDPSLFLMIRDAIKDFIVTATGKKNVLVALPDLDTLLTPKLRQIEQTLVGQKNLENYSPDMNALDAAIALGPRTNVSTPKDEPVVLTYEVSIAQKVQALENLLELIGIKVITLSEEKESNFVNTTSQMPSRISIILEQAFTQMRLKPVIECDHTTQTVVEKLKSVGSRITDIVNESTGEVLNFKYPYVEVDYDIISTLKDFNLIHSKVDPLIIWGEQNFILDFVQARFMDTGTPVAFPDDNFEEYIGKGTAPNLMFQVEGLNKDYLVKLTGLLNRNASNKTSLGEQTPLLGDGVLNKKGATILPSSFVEKLSEVSEDSKDFRKDTPAFLFGVPDANILSFDIDLDSQYTSTFKSIIPLGNNAEATVGALIPAGFGEQFSKLYKTWDSQKITDEFKKICDTFVGQPSFGGNELINFDEWKKIIKESLGKDLTGQKVKLLPDTNYAHASHTIPSHPTKAKVLKDQYYNFMWATFSKLFIKHREDIKRNVKIISGKEPERGAISYLNQLTQKLNELSLTAKVKSIPMFHLSSDYAAVNRSCVVYCREAKFAGVDKAVPEYTWFSGIYNMMGYIHTITKSSVESEFLLVRGPQSIATKNEKKKKAQEDLAANVAKLIGDPGPMLPGGYLNL